MKRNFRLRRSTDFKRVRMAGKSFANPLVVLLVLPNDEGRLRVGITAGRVMGKAVERNRAKRRLRACMASRQDRILSGWDMVLLARGSMQTAGFQQLQAAVDDVLVRSGVMPGTSNAAND